MINTSLLILFFLLIKWLFFIKIGDFDKILSVFLDAKMNFLVVDVEDAVEVAEEDVAEEDHGNITKHLRKSLNSQNAIPFQLSVQSFSLDKIGVGFQTIHLLPQLHLNRKHKLTEDIALAH